MHNNKLNLALIGYGKMGKIIEKLATDHGHTIALKTNTSHPLYDQVSQLSDIDVAVEFTNPDIAYDNLKLLAENGTPTVCGSTGWLEKYDEITELFMSNDTPFLYASNFSVGVNIFFMVNKYLATLMENHPDYNVKIKESHHLTKKDAPSGTAVTLAEQVIERVSRKSKWILDASQLDSDISMEARREGDVKGLHEVSYTSTIDEITIKHDAFNREGFALGAIKAAEYIFDKKGIFNMQDVLKL